MDKAGGTTLARIADLMLRKIAKRRGPRAAPRRFPEIAVEDLVAGAPQAALSRSITEGQGRKHVAGRDGIVEFHRVEQNRLAVDQGDIAKMKVAWQRRTIAGRPRATSRSAPPSDCARIRRQTLAVGLEEIGTGGKRLSF